MKFKSYYWAIIAASVLVALAIIVPLLIARGSKDSADAVTSPHTPEELAKLQSKAIDYTPQIQAYSDLITANPNDVTAMIGLGDIYMDSGRASDAAKWYQKAVDVSPSSPDYHGRLGDAYYQMGMTDIALRELQAGLSLDPNNQALMVVLGLVYDQTGKKDLAQQTWQKALNLNPKSKAGEFAQKLLSGPEALNELTGGGNP